MNRRSFLSLAVMSAAAPLVSFNTSAHEIAAMYYDYHDIAVAAKTAYIEARGEGRKGMEAVLHVIRNRVRDKRWPNDYTGVCRQTQQFTGWNRKAFNYPTALEVNFRDQTYCVAYYLAAMVLAGEADDFTLGANHYHDARMETYPEWADTAKWTVTIYRHKMYKL